MSRHLLAIILFALFVCIGGTAKAAPFEVRNIVVSIQSESAVKARDIALAKAQRVAFAALVGMTENDIPQISDMQIARLSRGFSLQGERLAARSYSANFTIRFNPASTNNFILTHNLSLTPQAAAGQTISVNRVVTDKPAAPVTAEGAVADGEAGTDAAPIAPAADAIVVVLPVLDIGSRRVIWDEPGLWRSVWQKKDHSVPGLSVRVPLGDVDDIADVPDASLLNNNPSNMAHMIERYAATDGYIIVAKNQGASMNTAGGMALSLYRHDGKQLKFIRKQVIRPRPGYLFDDAVPAAMQMIVSTHNNTASAEANTQAPAETLAQIAQATSGEANGGTTVDKSVLEAAPETINQSNGGTVLVTVPYQSLQQWLGIQRRLRMVPGMKSVVPLRVSPSSAQVSIKTNLSMADLERNLAMQSFVLQRLPNGETALLDQ